MAAAYLEWLKDIFEEAQIPYNAETAPYLDVCVRKVAGAVGEPEEVVFRKVRDRWLRHGAPGRQLLASFLRDEVFTRLDSPMRPVEGGGYYTAEYVVREKLPGQ